MKIRKNTEKIFWGIFFIAAAIFVIVGKLGFLSEMNVWTLLACILLVAAMIKSILNLWFPGILFPIAIGAILFDDVLGITQLTPWYVLGAALLGSIGLSMIFHKKRNHSQAFYQGKNDFTPEERDGSYVMFKTNMGSGIKYVKSEDFQRADLNTSFGDMKVFFDGACIRPGTVPVIDVNVSFGAIELYVPKEWIIINDAQVSFGAVEEKNSRNAEVGTQVHLTGNVNFGACEITFV